MTTDWKRKKTPPRRADVLAMQQAMVTWLSRQQVRDRQSPHCGCIYFPGEDRYCNRDTGCAAGVFLRQYRQTGVRSWLRQAEAARAYVWRAQEPDGGFPEMRGQAKSDGGSTVNTAIIADNLIAAFELGLPYGAADLDALARMAEFELTLEWKRGAFYHDTNHLTTARDAAGKVLWGKNGSHLDCQNTTALAAMMLLRIAGFLEAAGRPPPPAWRRAAQRAVRHLLAGQDSNGHWPYFVKEKSFDVGHHSMCTFCLAKAAADRTFRADPAVRRALTRAALWTVRDGLLQTKRGTKINWGISHSACVYFTAEYFLTAAPLARVAALDKRHGPLFRREAIELLRYVRTDLWDNAAWKTEGPFRLNEGYVVAGYAWFGQSMGWSLYQLDDLIERMGWWEGATSCRP